MKISQEDFGTLVICALRYCQGRQTYMPKYVQDIAKAHLAELSDSNLAVIMHDLESMRDGDYGDASIDKPNWIRFRYAVEAERERRNGKAD